MDWGEVTPRDLVRKSFTVAPSSRFSKSARAGTRVFLNTQTPLTLPGIRLIAAHWVQSNIVKSILGSAQPDKVEQELFQEVDAPKVSIVITDTCSFGVDRPRGGGIHLLRSAAAPAGHALRAQGCAQIEPRGHCAGAVASPNQGWSLPLWKLYSSAAPSAVGLLASSACSSRPAYPERTCFFVRQP